LLVYGGNVLALKDTIELLEYFYNVCEVSGCEQEASDFYELEDSGINVCDVHYKEIDNQIHFL
jgi:hypothetical protein